MSSGLPGELRVQKLRATLESCERVIHLISGTLGAPLFYDSGVAHYGFRYATPNWQHFCLLKLVRAVSGLNACIALIPGGFSQEIAVILRTVVECTTHSDYMLAGVKSTCLERPQKDYLDKFFSDFRRNSVSDFVKPKLRQGEIHKAVGSQTDQAVRSSDVAGEFSGVDSAKLMSNVYLTYSNYVHSRYPEVMDLYGGMPGQFHLGGIRGTLKDAENLDQLECFAVTVSNSLKFFVLQMQLLDRILSSDDLARWYNKDEA